MRILKRSVQDGFEAVQTREHRKQQRIQVAGHTFAVLRAEKLRARSVSSQYALDGVLQEQKHVERLLRIPLRMGRL